MEDWQDRAGTQFCAGFQWILGGQANSNTEYGLNKCVLKD